MLGSWYCVDISSAWLLEHEELSSAWLLERSIVRNHRVIGSSMRTNRIKGSVKAAVDAKALGPEGLQHSVTNQHDCNLIAVRVGSHIAAMQ